MVDDIYRPSPLKKREIATRNGDAGNDEQAASKNEEDEDDTEEEPEDEQAPSRSEKADDDTEGRHQRASLVKADTLTGIVASWAELEYAEHLLGACDVRGVDNVDPGAC